MLLTIDMGNTNTVFAVFEDDLLLGKWRIVTDTNCTADQYVITLKELLALENIAINNLNKVIISNVVPQQMFALTSFCKKYITKEVMVIGEKDINIDIEVKVNRPSEVGADRLVNAVAAYKKYQHAAIIIDFGTATTFDVISTEGHYIGGLIAPGINLSLDALHMAAAKLPEVSIERPAKVIGKNTIQAMQSGIYHGYTGLIEGIVSRVIEEYGSNMTVIATGGLAPLFTSATNIIQHLEPDLTIYGLKHIYEVNKKTQ